MVSLLSGAHVIMLVFTVFTFTIAISFRRIPIIQTGAEHTGHFLIDSGPLVGGQLDILNSEDITGTGMFINKQPFPVSVHRVPELEGPFPFQHG